MNQSRALSPDLPEPPALGSSLVWAMAAGLLALHAALAWYLRSPGIGTGNDDAVYVLLARSLRSWSYGDLFYVGVPTEAQYPPLYPSFLALLGGLFGERLTLFLAANVLLSVTGLALLFDVARRRNPVVALLTLALAAINPLLLSLAGGLRSEPLCMALTGLSLWLLAHPAPNRQAEVLAGAAAIGAALSRSAAVTLIAGVGIFWLLRRRWGAVTLLGLASAVTVGSWLAWTVVAPRQLPGRSYVADAAFARTAAADTAGRKEPAAEAERRPTRPQTESLPGPTPVRQTPPAGSGLLSLLALRLKTNLPAYAVTLMATIGVPTVADTSLDNLFWLVLLTTMGVLGLWGLRRWWMVAALTLSCHGLLLALWPYALARYLAPVLPLIVLAIFSGARQAEERARRWLPRLGPRNIVPIGLAIGILTGAVPRTIGQLTASAACGARNAPELSRCTDQAERAFFEATRYIASTTPDTARFLAAKEGAFYYYTGRQVVPIYAVTAGQVPDLREYLSRNRAEYVFLSHLKLDEWALTGPLLGVCRDMELVRSWGPATLLLRISAGAEPAQPDACDAIRDYAAAPWGNRLF